MTVRINQQLIVPSEVTGSRLDQFASEWFPDYSRSRIQAWIRSGELCVDGRQVKPNFKLAGGESLVLDASLLEEEQWQAEEIELDVLYEDTSVLILNKPSGLVVHPGAGNWSGTLLNGLLFHYPELATVPRAGIVHRLDKDTSGLMVVARDLNAQLNLVEQLQARSVSRTYWAVVQGELDRPGELSTAYGRHPTQRTRMAVLDSGGKEAITHYRPVTHFEGFTLVEVKLQTGRTHQIRVHMRHLGFPLVGDTVYGLMPSTAQLRQSPRLSPIHQFPRQALHAKSLGLRHPKTNEDQFWSSELPEDMLGLLELLDAES